MPVNLMPTNCSFDWKIDIHTGWFTVQIVTLLLLNLVTLVGNSLVILSVVLNKNLRSTTNLFIVSLACADLAVGFVVLPFSTANEVFKFWIFGKTLCRVWLSMDIWLCTASIYNLLAITIDRYMAVTKPLTYRFVISKLRAGVIIGLVWISSFLICLPFVVVHWPQGGPMQPASPNVSSFDADGSGGVAGGNECKCTQLDNPAGYIVYSACGSFYIPMIVICYFYFRIYKKVRQVAASAQSGLVSMSLITNPAVIFTAQVVATGLVKTKSSPALVNGGRKVRKQYSSNLRIHRGGYKPAVKKPTVAQQCKINGTVNNTNALMPPCPQEQLQTPRHSDSTATCATNSAETTPRLPSPFSSRKQALLLLGHGVGRNGAQPVPGKDVKGAQGNSNKLANYGKRYHRTLSIELKALKIVGIVTGCFLASWIGFSVVYAMQAMPSCRGGTCVSPTVVSIVVWLGYANSALNPFIYAACNQHYRTTFKRILRCTCFKFSRWERQRRQQRAVATLCRQAGACMLVVHSSQEHRVHNNTVVRPPNDMGAKN